MRLIRVTSAAVAVLALTATMALAGREDAPPPAADHGLDTATEASGHDVPVRTNEEEILEPEVEPDVAPEVEPEVPLTAEGGDHCIDPGGEDAETLVDGEEPNHGATVCGAARFGDWEAAGCRNHGQYVRTFANKNLDGEPGECEPSEALEAAGAEATVETVEAADTTTAPGNGNGRGNANGTGNGTGHERGQGRP